MCVADYHFAQNKTCFEWRKGGHGSLVGLDVCQCAVFWLQADRVSKKCVHGDENYVWYRVGAEARGVKEGRTFAEEYCNGGAQCTKHVESHYTQIVSTDYFGSCASIFYAKLIREIQNASENGRQVSTDEWTNTRIAVGRLHHNMETVDLLADDEQADVDEQVIEPTSENASDTGRLEVET